MLSRNQNSAGEKSSPTPKNGVAIVAHQNKTNNTNASFRTYEVYQRERTGESTEKIGPGDLTHTDQLTQPHRRLATLRENYPCYRDWAGNAYWLTRYNDVTSVFSDRANFRVATRAEDCGIHDALDLTHEPAAQRVWSDLIDHELPKLCESLLDTLELTDTPDLSLDYALTLCIQLQGRALGLKKSEQSRFAPLMWHLQRADSWQPEVALKAKLAKADLLALVRASREHSNPPHEGSLSHVLPDASDVDLLATVLGFEARTLHGWIANLFHALLCNPEAMSIARRGRTELKVAALEAMRFSPVVTYAHCYTRHEVERFGRLLPQGALMRLSAEAANRDPRVFSEPEQYKACRTDICHREARGQYRADGLATGIAFGMGLPSRHPAVPEDRPRSLYALTRDATVIAASTLLNRYPQIHPASVPAPISAFAMFEPSVAWSLPTQLTPA